MKTYKGLTSQKAIRQSFYDYCDEFGITVYRSKRQNDQPCDTRMAFVEYVDSLNKSGVISDNLAQRVRL